MKTRIFGIALLCSSLQVLAQSIPQKLSESDFCIGKSIRLHSSELGEDRVLNIYLPEGYQRDSAKSYPVIYLLDGSKEEDFIHISGLVQFGTFPWINMLPESIVVGIENVDRKRDFTSPSQSETDQSEFPSSGGSAAFMAFLEKELQAFMDSNYRTADSKTIIGQSLGGLLATEILFKKPDLFDHYIIVSPSLWWNDEGLLRESPVAYSTPKSIYIAVGKEGEIMERTARSLFEKLASEKRENTKLYFDFLEDKSHGDALHQAVYRAFEQIYTYH